MVSVRSEKMVVDDIYEGACVESVLAAEDLFCFAGGRVRVSISVDGTVEADALPNLFGIGMLSGPFDEVAHQVADREAGVVEGEVGVGKVVHGAKVAGMGSLAGFGLISCPKCSA